jgi:hypothetical protein
VTVNVKESEMGDLSDFERGQIEGVRLVEASVTKTATILRVSERQFLRLCRHTRRVRRQHGENLYVECQLTAY